MRKVNNLIVFLCLTLFTGLTSGQLSAQEAKQWTLEECIDYALQNNLSLARAELTNERANLTYKQSRYELLPNLNASGSYSFNYGRNIDPFTNTIVTEESQFSRASISSSVTLFSGITLRNTIKQNKVLLEASKLDYENTRDNVSLDVVTFYLNVIFTQELLKNAQDQKASTQEQLNRTTQMVEAGSLPLSNQLDLEAQLAGDESNVISAENNLRMALLTLKQQLQIPATQPFDIVVPALEMAATESTDKSVNDIYDAALQSRPNVRSAQLNVESSIIGEQIAKGAYYPTLSAGYTLGTNYSSLAEEFLGFQPFIDTVGFLYTNNDQYVAGLNFERLTNPDYTYLDQMVDNRNGSIFLSLNIPIFNAFRTRTNVQQAAINRQLAEIALKETENQLRQIIETAYNDVVAAAKSYEASDKQVAALREAFRVNEERYEVGAVNFTEYQVSKNNLNRAENDLVRAKFDYIFKLKIVDFYLGNPLTL